MLLRNNPQLKFHQEQQDVKNASFTGFEDCWDPVASGFPSLRLFACSLATVFPGSSTVVSDFQITKLSNNDHRSSLADISIKGIFYAKQWIEVKQLNNLSLKKIFLAEFASGLEVAEET